MAQMLAQLVPKNTYAKQLYQAFTKENGAAVETAVSPATHTIQSPLIEPLSERELDVLRLIAEGCSNQEIALNLTVSLSTVKWHSSNIYSKLGVKNRSQAVAKARMLGLLAS